MSRRSVRARHVEPLGQFGAWPLGPRPAAARAAAAAGPRFPARIRVSLLLRTETVRNSDLRLAVMDIDWNNELAEQLDWQWQNHLRPRLDGLTDDEYFWEPVPGCWTLRHAWHPDADDHGRHGRVPLRVRLSGAGSPAGDDHRLAARARDRGCLCGAERIALWRAAGELARVLTTRVPPPRRSPSSTTRTRPGSRACAASALTA